MFQPAKHALFRNRFVFQSVVLVSIVPPPPQLNWFRFCMQRNDLAALSGVSAWTQNHQFIKFLFLMQRQTYQRHWKLWETLKPFMFGYIPTPSPVSVWFRSYIFILKVVPINTLKPENTDLFIDIVVVWIIYQLILV